MNIICLIGIMIVWNLSSASGQDSTLSKKSMLIDTQKKKGVYRSFTEFQQNNPSYVDTFFWETVVINPALKTKYTRVKLKTINVKGKAKNIKGTVWGFCNGEDVYVHSSSYSPILHFGYYCVFKDSGMTMGHSSFDGPSMSSYWYSDTYILDYTTGTRRKLTKSNLKYILKEDPVLLEQFKNEKGGWDLLLEYVLKFNKRNELKILGKGK